MIKHYTISKFYLFFSIMNIFMASMENFFAYTPMQYFAVSHLLSFTFAVMIAALVYFVMTTKQVSAKYRVLSAISGVVMISAFLILYFQAQAWESAFTFNELTGMFEKVEGELFTNGYRYLNWLIDVPMLLIQMVIVIAVAWAKRFKLGSKFVFSGVMMILTWYVGQFFEVTSNLQLFVWGAISTVFFIHILYLMNNIIKTGIADSAMPKSAKKILSNIWILFLVTWILYPIAYIMPAISMTAEWVVVRQLLFTIADVWAKVIYGIMIMQVVQIRSKAEGYVMAD